MSAKICFCLLILIVSLFLTPSAYESTYTNILEYEISLSDLNGPVEIDIHYLTNQDSLITFDLLYKMRHTLEESYLLSTLDDISIQNGNHEPVKYSIENNRITINEQVNEIFISYQLDEDVILGINDINENYVSMSFEETCLFLSPIGTLLFPLGHEDEISLEFDYPEDMMIITNYHEEDKDVYSCPKIFEERIVDLYYGITIIGYPYKLYEKQQGDTLIQLCYFGTDDENKRLPDTSWGPILTSSIDEAYDFNLDLIEWTIEELERIYGDFPLEKYIVFDRGNSRHYNWAFGIEPSYYYERICWTIHHMFHAYNFGSMGLIRNSDNFSYEEGISMYYQHMLAYKYTENELFLGAFYIHYLSYMLRADKGLLPSRQAFESDDLVERDQTKYVWTELAIALLDNTILSKSEGTYSIDDVQKYLYEHRGEEDVNLYTLRKAAYKVTGKSFSSFFETHFETIGEFGEDILFCEDYSQYFSDLVAYYATVYFNGYNSGYMLFHDVATFTADIDFWGQNPLWHDIDMYFYPFLDYIIDNYDIDNLAEEDIINALEHWTDVDQGNFFTFYEIDGIRPMMNEIRELIREYNQYGRLNYEQVITPFDIEYDTSGITKILDKKINNTDIQNANQKLYLNLFPHVKQELIFEIYDEKFWSDTLNLQVTFTNDRNIITDGFFNVQYGYNGNGDRQINALFHPIIYEDKVTTNITICPSDNSAVTYDIRSDDDKYNIPLNIILVESPDILLNKDIIVTYVEGVPIVCGKDSFDLTIAHEYATIPCDENDIIVLGGPIANPLIVELATLSSTYKSHQENEYDNNYDYFVSNSNPGWGKGIIEKIEYNGQTYIVIAGSDRNGTKKALEWFINSKDYDGRYIIIE
ncbi:hypothetical protein EF808_02345 [archaeon]|nr:MAG: hypothetical protein EF808_02345 [archaeon]